METTRKNSTSGHTGVTYDRKSCSWRAQKVVNKINRYIGNYATKDEAVQARIRFDKRLENESRHIFILDGPPNSLVLS